MARVGFYTTVVRPTGSGRKVGYLFGPFDCEFCARERIPQGRKLAEKIDPFAAFDLFGTASITTDGDLPVGTFNATLEK